MKNANAYIKVGKIGATYGIHGWLKVYFDTEWGDSILQQKTWYLARDQENWRAVGVQSSKWHGKTILAKFAGFDTPETAQAFVGTHIAIKRADLPALKENEYYWSDLEGLTVINTQGLILGKVIYLIATGANDVLVIKGKETGDKEIAIPFLLQKVIMKVDLSKGEILVNWEYLD